MALRAVLIGPDGTVYKDGRADQALLDGLVVFIKRMQAKGVHVAPVVPARRSPYRTRWSS